MHVSTVYGLGHLTQKIVFFHEHHPFKGCLQSSFLMQQQFLSSIDLGSSCLDPKPWLLQALCTCVCAVVLNEYVGGAFSGSLWYLNIISKISSLYYFNNIYNKSFVTNKRWTTKQIFIFSVLVCSGSSGLA